MTGLVNSNNKAVNTDTARAAFQKLLVPVDNELSLRHLCYDLPVVVYTDASLRGLGGILVNVYPEGTDWVVNLLSHFSRTRRAAEKLSNRRLLVWYIVLNIGMTFYGVLRFCLEQITGICYTSIVVLRLKWYDCLSYFRTYCSPFSTSRVRTTYCPTYLVAILWTPLRLPHLCLHRPVRSSPSGS